MKILDLLQSDDSGIFKLGLEYLYQTHLYKDKSYSDFFIYRDISELSDLILSYKCANDYTIFRKQQDIYCKVLQIYNKMRLFLISKLDTYKQDLKDHPVYITNYKNYQQEKFGNNITPDVVYLKIVDENNVVPFWIIKILESIDPLFFEVEDGIFEIDSKYLNEIKKLSPNYEEK